ncbi:MULTISPECIES: hypothetical protein [unclassified Lysobacter]|uniref:hypothetical protein n=1 Tax=unclassified Lysobacter TaxID=2635362 RepID=UPI001BE6650D|nr:MULTISPECIES: hypothetical protein [unclassified Lysobacter]MBT2748016.1 hypothetical protein [Lysobacter sp. ISL-42]MBT2752772.1 hypothetical protein [Lysobacter sp. ISL-50]MBT2779360.1 hypothetical protein [Lysobacter sp. ISL-54]MBT2781916.1 hypothetical protein [Lysobacter sp. ISL-52]
MEVPAATEDAAAPWLVYVLAHQRDRSYIVGVGRDLEQIGYDAFEHGSRIMKSANRYSRDPFLLMWYEIASGREQALARAAQIRRWPHAWQRRLVETGNPQWLEQWKREIGVSPLFWAQVPEISPRASLPRIPDSARSCRRLRSLHYLCPVPRPCADPEPPPPSCPEPRAQQSLPSSRHAPSALARDIFVSSVVCALLIMVCAACYSPAA